MVSFAVVPLTVIAVLFGVLAIALPVAAAARARRRDGHKEPGK